MCIRDRFSNRIHVGSLFIYIKKGKVNCFIVAFLRKVKQVLCEKSARGHAKEAKLCDAVHDGFDETRQLIVASQRKSATCADRHCDNDSAKPESESTRMLRHGCFLPAPFSLILLLFHCHCLRYIFHVVLITFHFGCCLHR